jgi:hypothetical protein
LLLMTFMVLFKKLMKLEVCRTFERVGGMVVLQSFLFCSCEMNPLLQFTSCFAKSWVTEVECLSEQRTMRRVMRWSLQLELGKRMMV